MKNKILSSLILFLLLSFTVRSQQASLTIQSVSSCHHTEVSVAVTLQNFYNVGAISLFVGYDTTYLDFVRIQNIHPNFNGLLYNEMTYPQTQIGISWTSVMGVSLGSGILFEMVFDFQDQQNALVFNPGCEITTTDLEIIPVLYTGGAISPLISILSQPEDQQVVPPDGVSFQIVSSGGDSYQWQKSESGGVFFENLTDGVVYQGTNTESLTLSSTSPEMDGTLFRCKIMAGTCIKISAPAALTVAGLEQEIELSAGWNSFSTFLDPDNNDLETVLADIMSSLIILVNDNGFYYPATNTNTIGSFDPTKGYYLKLANDKTLRISGLRLQNNQLDIPVGWSCLPVISDCDHNILSLFGGQLQDVILIKEIAGSRVYWPEKNITTLQILQTGKSYLIKTLNPLNVNFPECSK